MAHIPENWLYPSGLQEATALQKELSQRIVLQDTFLPIQHIGGMDVSNNLYDPAEMIYAAAVLLNGETLKLEAHSSTAFKQLFPYISGFLGFREAPALVSAFHQLPYTPEIFFVDGHGISHPRRFGIASHLGVLLDIPTIGVAKTILVGKPVAELGPHVGDHVPLQYKGETIAFLVRSKKNCLPLIISPGHRITLETALEIVMQCLKGYRLPEPTRYAHLMANQCRKEHSLTSV